MKKNDHNVYVVLEQNDFNIKAHGPFYDKKEAQSFNAALMYSRGVKGKIVTFETWETRNHILASMFSDTKIQDAMIKEGKKVN